MPADQVLTLLVKAEEKMGNRFGDASGYGLSDIGTFQQKLELEVKDIKNLAIF